jgi:phosphohistidine phosphatase
MNIYFMRHGIAIAKDDPSVTADHERPLTDKGAKRVRQAAKGMRRLGLSFDLLLSSPLVRARQTAEIVAGLLHYESPIEELKGLTPQSTVDQFIEDLARYQDRASLLLFGHEPSLSNAVGHLIAAKGGRGVRLHFKKSGLCLVEIEAPVRPNGGTLSWLLTAKQLRLLGETPAKR